MINVILICVGVVVMLTGIYALIKILSSKRKFLLDMVDGDYLAFVSLIAWMLTFIGAASYWIFSSIDFETARSFRRHIHTFAETYLFEGGAHVRFC